MIGSNRLSSSPHCLNWPIFPPKIAFYENSTASSIEKIVGIHHPLHLPSILLLPTFSLSYRKGWLNRCPQMFLGGWQTHLTSWCFRRVCELLLLEGSFAYKQQPAQCCHFELRQSCRVGWSACLCLFLSVCRPLPGFHICNHTAVTFFECPTCLLSISVETLSTYRHPPKLVKNNIFF
jgi:hypothetical protein